MMTRPTPSVYENILETIGRTPMIRLNELAKDIPGEVLAKVEYFNPGHSTKDRMALKMVEDAERDGRLKPGGTIIECTSGNTGMGLALAAVIKGYRLICTMSDKQSKEKMDVLRALGAEIHVCPTNVAPEHPDSYYSVARRLNGEIANSFFPNQYDNLSNRQAHYETTGPEIWEQTGGRITHFIVGVGTGGTISGVAQYLKEKNPNIQIWGVDTYGSVFKKYHETGEFDTKEIYGYIDAVTVVLFHDHGSRYVGKIYNDDWMRERGFLREEWKTLGEAVQGRAARPLVTIGPEEPINNAIVQFKRLGISQLPVHDGSRYVGSLTESHVITALTSGEGGIEQLVRTVMGAPFPSLSASASLHDGVHAMGAEFNALIVSAPGGDHIVSKHDLLAQLA